MKLYPSDLVVVGIIGRAAAGKDVLADYLRAHCDASHFSIGDIAREIAQERGVEPTRENLHDISQEYYRKRGKGFFIQRVICEIEAESSTMYIISGIRSPHDVKLLRDHYGSNFLLVGVEVNNAQARFERVRNRDDPRDPQSYEAFKQQDDEEEAIFEISKTLRSADLTLVNNNNLESFHQDIQNKLVEGVLAEHCQSNQNEEPT